jgi:hypothetical protein
MTGIDPEGVAKMAEEGAAFIANQQAEYAAEQAAEAARVASLTPAPAPLYQNAQAYQGAATAAMFPPGWGSEGETPEGTIYRNAVEGLWLPLFIPEGQEGSVPPPLPSVILYATQQVPAQLTADCGGEAHSSEEVNDCRFARAAAMATEAATYPGSTSWAREAG